MIDRPGQEGPIAGRPAHDHCTTHLAPDARSPAICRPLSINSADCRPERFFSGDGSAGKAVGRGGWLCFRCLQSPGPPRTPCRAGTLTIWWRRMSQCHRGVLSPTFNTNWEEKALHTIRRTRRVSHTPSWRRAQNAVCLNGVGHERDASPNAASSDACTHNFLTLMLAGRWRRCGPGN
jgi:hypothetical protein